MQFSLQNNIKQIKVENGFVFNKRYNLMNGEKNIFNERCMLKIPKLS